MQATYAAHPPNSFRALSSLRTARFSGFRLADLVKYEPASSVLLHPSLIRLLPHFPDGDPGHLILKGSVAMLEVVCTLYTTDNENLSPLGFFRIAL